MNFACEVLDRKVGLSEFNLLLLVFDEKLTGVVARTGFMGGMRRLVEVTDFGSKERVLSLVNRVRREEEDELGEEETEKKADEAFFQGDNKENKENMGKPDKFKKKGGGGGVGGRGGGGGGVGGGGGKGGGGGGGLGGEGLVEGGVVGEEGGGPQAEYILKRAILQSNTPICIFLEHLLRDFKVEGNRGGMTPSYITVYLRYHFGSFLSEEEIKQIVRRIGMTAGGRCEVKKVVEFFRRLCGGEVTIEMILLCFVREKQVSGRERMRGGGRRKEGGGRTEEGGGRGGRTEKGGGMREEGREWREE